MVNHDHDGRDTAPRLKRKEYSSFKHSDLPPAIRKEKLR